MFDLKSFEAVVVCVVCLAAAEWLWRKGRLAWMAGLALPAAVLVASAAGFVAAAIWGGFAIYGQP